MLVCYHCKKELKSIESIGRLATCPNCHADVHICYHCEFYDIKAYNECREPQAERVLDKDRANFCDYFKPNMGQGLDLNQKKQESFEALKNLFKK